MIINAIVKFDRQRIGLIRYRNNCVLSTNKIEFTRIIKRDNFAVDGDVKYINRF